MARVHDVNWPESEPIPQSIAEALALGWVVDGDWSQSSEDELTRTGVAEVTKTGGMVGLCLEIPFRAEYHYGHRRPPGPLLIPAMVPVCS